MTLRKASWKIFKNLFRRKKTSFRVHNTKLGLVLVAIAAFFDGKSLTLLLLKLALLHAGL